MLISKNIKFLRGHHQLTQKQFAEKLGIKQSAVGAYEEARATPPLSCLLDISEKFGVSMDVLTRKDLSTVPVAEWKNKSGKEILAITVNDDGNENVELVSQKASAGYLNGYQDTEFISELPKIKLPLLSRNATYRAFEIKGDSMLPLQPGSIVFGAYVDNLTTIKNNSLCIIVSKQEGIVFKRVFNFVETENKLLLVSDNKQYAPYFITVDDILEVWLAKAFFSTSFPDVEQSTVSLDHLAAQIVALQNELTQWKK